MRKSLAVVLFFLLCAVSASAGTITSLSPNTFRVNSGEQFITVYGTGLGNRLIYDGPAGHFEVDANAQFSGSIVGWVPEAIIARTGTYTLNVSGPLGNSGPATFTVTGFRTPLFLLLPEYVRIQPKTREGAYVKYEVFAMGGSDSNPRVSCDPSSGSFFKMGTTTVNCIATNIYGERATGSFPVYVRDEEAPVLFGPREPIVVKAESIEGAVVDYKVTAVDDIYGDLETECLPKPGSLFPIGVMGDDNKDGFKYMREGNLRYDHVLLAIVEEVSRRYGVAFDRFGLFGYSGGGHFAHRFLMLQPNKLWGVSIGAPGSVTLLDPSRDWWVGTRNFATLFGQELDIPAMKQVAVQMVVGAADLETWEITHKPGGRNWMPDANHAGTNRPERLASLRDNFAAHGIAARFDLVPNTPHDGVKVVPVVEDFFAGELRRIRAARKAA